MQLMKVRKITFLNNKSNYTCDREGCDNEPIYLLEQVTGPKAGFSCFVCEECFDEFLKLSSAIPMGVN